MNTLQIKVTTGLPSDLEWEIYCSRTDYSVYLSQHLKRHMLGQVFCPLVLRLPNTPTLFDNHGVSTKVSNQICNNL